MSRLLLFPVALLITLSIFAFMQRLINVDASKMESVDVAAVVELYKPPPPEPPEDEPEPEPEDSADEPSMEPVTAASPAAAQSLSMDMPATDTLSMGLDIGPVGEGWSAPVAASGGLDGLGKDNSGYIEVVPYTTQQPRIPELAWKNKTSGWVLVVFNVDRRGATKNIRVLDANPRGIFEESVVKAVGSWRYSVSGIKNYRGDMVLTQRIELNWKDYRRGY